VTCTTYGEESLEDGWSQYEIDLLEAELELARRKVKLQIAKDASYGDIDQVNYFLESPNFIGNITVEQWRDTIRIEEQKVYEAAHDRHFLDSAKQQLHGMQHGLMPAHQPRKKIE
jgi:hypothetical protein